MAPIKTNNPYASYFDFFSRSGTDAVGAAKVTYIPSIALAHSSSPYIAVYPWDSGFGVKYADPSTLPTGTGYGVAFSPDGANIAVSHNSSPYISAYPWSGSGFGAKYADPSTLPTGRGWIPKFSPDGADLAVAHISSPYISVYPWSSGFGTKYADPSTLPTGTGYSVDFAPDGNTIAVAVSYTHLTLPTTPYV